MSDFVIENGILVKYIGPGGDVVVPEGVKEIAKSAFDQYGIDSIILPEGVVTLGRDAFMANQSIKNIVLPESLKTIGYRAFYASRITCITIPAGVVEIANMAFYGCVDLKKIVNLSNCPVLHTLRDDLPPKEGVFPNEDLAKLPKKIKERAIQLYLEGKKKYPKDAQKRYDAFIRKQSATILTDYAKRGKTKLIRIMLDGSYVTANAFEKAIPAAKTTELRAELLEYQNRQMGGNAAKNAAPKPMKEETETEKLKKLWKTQKLPDGTRMVTAYKGLESNVIVPRTIGKSTVSVIGETSFNSFTGDRNEKHRETGILTVTLPETILRIDKKAFAGCKCLIDVSIAPGVVQIGEYAFAGCEKMHIIQLPMTVSHIGSYAFTKCTSLEQITIPGKMTYIEHDAFSGCDKLTINAPAGSYAEAYAKENNIPFEAL